MTEEQAAPIAWIHIGIGEYDAAFDWLERALEEDPALLISLPSFGFWDPIGFQRSFPSGLRSRGISGIRGGRTT